MKSLAAQLFADLYRADIARVFDDLLQRQPAVFFGVVDGVAADAVIAIFAVENRVGRAAARLQGRRRAPRLRRQLADVLVMAGRPKEAVPILLELADDRRDTVAELPGRLARPGQLGRPPAGGRRRNTS